LGNLIKMDSSENGILLWTKEYDSAGNLIEYCHLDYESDTDSSFFYKDNRLFKIAYHYPRETYEPTCIYYPNDDLIVSNAEPLMQCNFLLHPIDTFKLELSSKVPLVITKILNSSENLSFLDSNQTKLSLPFIVVPGRAIYIYLVYKPTPENSKEQEFFDLVTNTPINDKYRINVTTNAWHFDFSDMERIPAFSLSKKTDKYLVTPAQPNAVLIVADAKGNEKGFLLYKLTKVDLKQFDAGVYQVLISGCDISPNTPLTIKE